MLFLPVSGARGMGEYARALALATAAVQRWPNMQVHFAVSAQAPYAEDTPFPKTLLPASPTFHSPEVAEIIAKFRPTLVVFDNAGRTAQLQSAVRSGAKVIYVSSRSRQRRRGFRFRWMSMIDEHWIAYPEFIAGSLTRFERLKARLVGRPNVRFLDAVLPPRDPALAVETMARFNISFGDYVLVVPGGGSSHPGAERTPEIIAEAARRLAETGVPTVLVGVTPSGSLQRPPPHALHVAPRMPMAQLAELMRGARLVISNGGDTLLQAISAARPCIAVPIAGDQAHRIARCEGRGLAQG
ncbi:MAG: glycosyltransferase, partial [Steroidobacteraceae bacterium]